MPFTLTSGPFCAVEYFATTCGRPGLHVDVGRPVHRRVVLLGDQQLAGLAIQRVAEAVAIEVHERLVGLPLTSMSARIISLTPSKSHSSCGVIW